MSKLIDNYLKKRGELAAAVTTLHDAAAAEDRDLTDAEQATADDTMRQIGELDARIEPLQAAEAVLARHKEAIAQLPAADPEQRAQAPQGAPQSLTVRAREQKPYENVGEFMVDLVRTMRFPGSQEGMPRFDRAAVDRVSAALGRTLGDVAAGDHVTTEDVPGLLPVSIVGQIQSDLDATRPLINAIGAIDMGNVAGKTFNRPHVTKHHDQGDGIQPDEKAEGQGGEVKVEGIPFNKESFLRWMNVSMQTIDWTSPGAWQILINEFLAEYAIDTELWAEKQAFAGVVATENVATDDYAGWVEAFYAARLKAMTAGGVGATAARRALMRIPDLIVVSMDMDGAIGSMLDIAAATAQKVDGTPLQRFGGLLAQTPRLMLPGLAAGTVAYGRKKTLEFYEQRKGFLQAIEPKVMGVEVAYGGYAAAGNIDPTAWVKLVAPAPAP